MLETVKQCISDLPDSKFDDFYQDYIVASEKMIIDSDLNVAARDYREIEDACKIIQGINKLTEELKFL